MISTEQNRTIVRAGGIYDLVVTIGFATPFTAMLSLDMVLGAGRMMGLEATTPAFGPLHMLFVNLMGSLVVVWSLLRITYPTQTLGRFDAMARGLFAVWLLWAVAGGAPAIILAFVIFEFAFGVAQVLPVRSERLIGPAERGFAG